MTPDTPRTLTPGPALDHTIVRILYGPWDASKCRICGWPVYPDLSLGCILGNCSRRPIPIVRADAAPHFSDPRTDADKAALLDAVIWLSTRHKSSPVDLFFAMLFLPAIGRKSGVRSQEFSDSMDLPTFALHIVRLVLISAQVTELDEVPQ